jgi:hypothetical protein
MASLSHFLGKCNDFKPQAAIYHLKCRLQLILVLLAALFFSPNHSPNHSPLLSLSLSLSLFFSLSLVLSLNFSPYSYSNETAHKATKRRLYGNYLGSSIDRTIDSKTYVARFPNDLLYNIARPRS